jgi:hypothetical protein
MSTFIAYFNLGIRHISNIHSVEHALFLIALCTVYLLRDWKKVFILVVFYAIGHILTLILSTLNIFSLPEEITNYLIPVTIFFTAASNIFRKYYGSPSRFQFSYIPALLFGLIHGFGFADYFSSIVTQIKNTGFLLTSFVLGLETGQLIIVSAFLFLSWLFVNNFGINRRDWVLVISSGIAGIALTYMFEARFWVN